MSRAYNVQAVEWFLDRVWPPVLAAVPEARFYVVGSSPPEAIRARHDGESVFVTGFVEDLGAWYRAADLFVSPILVAGGLLQKVLDALGTGTPVVATSVSNHGISATPGEHLIVADDPEPFAQAVIALLGDPERRRALGEAGRAFALDRYDPDVTLGRWERALRELVR
jgi:glycosyltransferase involved in cell wall biosynthesis